MRAPRWTLSTLLLVPLLPAQAAPRAATRPKVELIEHSRFRVPDGEAVGVAWSRDGARIAAAGRNGDVVVWRTKDWQLETTLDVRAHPGMQVLFDPSGKRIVTMGRSFAVWDLATAQVLVQETATGIHGAAFSADGRWLAHYVALGRIRVRDAATLAVTRTLEWTENLPTFVLAFGPGEDELTAAGSDAMLRTFAVATGEILRTEPAGGTPWNSLAWLEDGTRIGSRCARLFRGDAEIVSPSENAPVVVTVAGDGRTFAAFAAPMGSRLQIHRRDGGEPLTITTPVNMVAAALSPDGTRAAAACSDGKVRVFEDGRSIRELSGTGDAVTSLAFAAHSSYLVVSGAKGVACFDLEQRALNRRPLVARMIAAAHSGRFFALGRTDITEFEPARAEPIATHRMRIPGSILRCRPDDYAVVLTGSGQNDALVFDLGGKWPRDLYATPPSLDAAWLDDGRLVCAGLDKAVHLVDAAGATLHKTELGHALKSVARDRSGQTVVVTSQLDRGTPGWKSWVLDARTLQVRKEIPGRADGFVFLDDTLAVSHDPEGLTLWRVPMFVVLERVPWRQPLAVAVHPGGKLMAVADAFQVRVLEVRR